MALAILAFPHIAAAIKEPAAFKDFWCIFIEHRHADFIPAKCEDFVMQLLHSIERLSIETRRGVVNLAFGKPHFPILVHWVPMNRRGHLVRGRNRFQTVLEDIADIGGEKTDIGIRLQLRLRLGDGFNLILDVTGTKRLLNSIKNDVRVVAVIATHLENFFDGFDCLFGIEVSGDRKHHGNHSGYFVL